MGTLGALDFAGENAVMGVEDAENQSYRVRDATLTAESDCEFLRLSTEDWRALLRSGLLGKSIVTGLEKRLMQREKANTATIQNTEAKMTGPDPIEN